MVAESNVAASSQASCDLVMEDGGCIGQPERHAPTTGAGDSASSDDDAGDASGVQRSTSIPLPGGGVAVRQRGNGVVSVGTRDLPQAPLPGGEVMRASVAEGGRALEEAAPNTNNLPITPSAAVGSTRAPGQHGTRHRFRSPFPTTITLRDAGWLKTPAYQQEATRSCRPGEIRFGGYALCPDAPPSVARRRKGKKVTKPATLTLHEQARVLLSHCSPLEAFELDASG